MTSLHVGDQLDHFQVESLVARSGMASIFRATDRRDGRTVAIKLPHPEMECDPILYERFQREDELGSRMDHPGVMKVLPVADKSRLYMVMEWVPGRLLREVLRDQRPMPIPRAVAILRQLCDALGYIHGLGVVHRDLKPENVMVDAADRIKLIDFGIAGDVAARRITFAKLTQMLGTPDYISPEQVKGQRGDPRSDLFALGVMLYEMVTGDVPYHGPNAFAIMNDRLLNNPVPPRELNPEVSPQLQEVIYRALERDPKQRYATAAELAWDLDHLDEVGVAERAEMQNWRRRRTPVSRQILFYVAMALIPVVVFGLLLWVARH